MIKEFNFTKSFEETLKRFDHLPIASKTDYYRSKEKAMKDKNRNIDVDQVRDYFSKSSDSELEEFIHDGLLELILELEQDDYFGTEGFNKRLG